MIKLYTVCIVMCRMADFRHLRLRMSKLYNLQIQKRMLDIYILTDADAHVDMYLKI